MWLTRCTFVTGLDTFAARSLMYLMITMLDQEMYWLIVYRFWLSCYLVDDLQLSLLLECWVCFVRECCS
jgi:hypothetical protein